MKNLFYFLLGFCAVFIIGNAFAAGPGLVPLTQPVLLSTPVGTTLDAILAGQSSTPLLDNIINQASSSGPVVRNIPATATTPAQVQGLSNAWQVTGSILTATGYIMARWQPALGAAAVGIGYFAKHEFNLKKAYDDLGLQTDPAFASAISAQYPVSSTDSVPGTSSYFMYNGLKWKVSTAMTNNNTEPLSWFAGQTSFISGVSPTGTFYKAGDAVNGPIVLARRGAYAPPNYWSLNCLAVRDYSATAINYPLPGTSTTPSVLPVGDIPGLAQKIVDAMPNNSAIKTALDNLTTANPSLIREPLPITNNHVNNYKTNQINQALNNTVTTTNNNYLNDPSSATATASAVAVAEQAKEENKETFNPPPADAFNTPFVKASPTFGERFTTFINNMKASPLFSFSQGFFGSVPGGGSPVFTVNAGTYGTHTYDMSIYLTAGLVVLKSVLLCMFGFLSIRTVILKR